MKTVRFGFWMPIFGGWLRNVEDEQMAATFDYNKRLAQRAEQIGFDISLLAELNLNDIKGAPLRYWNVGLPRRRLLRSPKK